MQTIAPNHVDPTYKVRRVPYSDGPGTTLLVRSERDTFGIVYGIIGSAILLLFPGVLIWWLLKAYIPSFPNFWWTYAIAFVLLAWLVVRSSLSKTTTITVTPDALVLNNAKSFALEHISQFSIAEEGADLDGVVMVAGTPRGALRMLAFREVLASVQSKTVSVAFQYGSKWVQLVTGLSLETARQLASELNAAAQEF